jgi:hypothetical protein
LYVRPDPPARAPTNPNLNAQPSKPNH